MPFVDKIIKGILGMGDNAVNMFKTASFTVRTFFFDVAKAVLGNIDTLITGFADGIDGLITRLNKFLPEKKQIGLLQFKSELAKGLGAAPVMGELSNMKAGFEGFTESMTGFGTSFAENFSAKYNLKDIEKGNQRIKKSSEALKRFTDVSEKMGESVQGISRGLKTSEDAAERGFQIAKGIGTLNISSALERIRQTRDVLDDTGKKIGEESVLLDSDQVKALDHLKTSLGDLTQISPKLAEAFEAAFADPTKIEGLKKLEIQAQDAIGNFTAFRSAVTQTGTAISDALVSGNAIAAETALEQLKRSATESADAFRLIGEEDAALFVLEEFRKSLGKDIDANEFLESLTKLAAAQQELAVATAAAKIATGDSVPFLQKMNELTEIRLKNASMELEISKGVDDDREKEIKRQQELNEVITKRLELESRLMILRLAGKSSGSAAAANAADAMANAVAIQGLQQQRDDLQAEIDKNRGTLTEDQLKAKTAALDALNQRINILAASSLKGTLDSLAADFKKLGPEGELMAAVSEGAANMAVTFTSAFEIMTTEGASASEKIQAGLMAVGSAISTIANVQKASSDARIRAIDKEIEAEKKRDGKSAASVAKIKELEKKKKQEERKAFEQKKKTDSANVIISTASAAMQAFSMMGPIAGSIMAAFIVAMGAQQLATIQSQTFDGGGSGVGAAGRVAVGERSNSVDLARSQGGAGELAYMRGDRGQGGPEDFRPAFMGYKSRAEGGNTGFMVGEQGPEMFVPERPGRIIPADDIAAPTPVNANINISAIDAAGVEDVLIRQRGNIISMIRDAANAQGNTFLENINVAEL
jgi:hypothetical protein